MLHTRKEMKKYQLIQVKKHGISYTIMYETILTGLLHPIFQVDPHHLWKTKEKMAAHV